MEYIKETQLPRRAKALLNRMVGTKQMSESGMKWLVVATDPFHDTRVDCDGYPDISTARAITQCVQQTINVSSPFDDGTLPYDFHMFFNPLSPTWSYSPTLEKEKEKKTITRTKSDDTRPEKREKSEELVNALAVKKAAKRRPPGRANSGTAETFNGYIRSTVDYLGDVVQTADALYLSSGWTGFTLPNGDDWTTATEGEAITGVSIPSEFTTGNYRVVATACEVVNVTSELYKGGTVTAYKSPCPTFNSTLNSGSIGGVLCETGTLPPTNQPDAALYPDSLTWGAEDGVYMIATQTGMENPFVQPLPGVSGLFSPSDFTSLETGVGWLAYLPAYTTDFAFQSALSKKFPYDITGAIFTGLNGQSQLQVTTKYYIERVPSIADENNLVLSRLPAPYDPLAMEVYSRVLEHLPVACKVCENPMGEWWNDVLEAVAEWAPKIGKGLGDLGIPMVSPIGNILGAGAKLAMKNRGHKPGQVLAIMPAKKKNKPKNKGPVSKGPSTPKGGGSKNKNARKKANAKAYKVFMNSVERA